MGPLVRQFLDSRERRDDARAQLDTRIAQVREDLDARSVGGRVADRVVGDAQAMLEEAADLAGEHRTLIIGTIAAVAVWLLRNPIMSLVGMITGDD